MTTAKKKVAKKREPVPEPEKIAFFDHPVKNENPIATPFSTLGFYSHLTARTVTQKETPARATARHVLEKVAKRGDTAATLADDILNVRLPEQEQTKARYNPFFLNVHPKFFHVGAGEYTRDPFITWQCVDDPKFNYSIYKTDTPGAQARSIKDALIARENWKKEATLLEVFCTAITISEILNFLSFFVGFCPFHAWHGNPEKAMSTTCWTGYNDMLLLTRNGGGSARSHDIKNAPTVPEIIDLPWDTKFKRVL